MNSSGIAEELLRNKILYPSPFKYIFFNDFSDMVDIKKKKKILIHLSTYSYLSRMKFE